MFTKRLAIIRGAFVTVVNGSMRALRTTYGQEHVIPSRPSQHDARKISIIYIRRIVAALCDNKNSNKQVYRSVDRRAETYAGCVRP